MQFNFSYDPGTSLDHMLAFEVAGQVWESYLQDDVTINLQVGVTSSSNLPTGVIGGALPGMQAQVSYREYRDRYYQDLTSTQDQIASSHMRWDKSVAKYEFIASTGENYGSYESSDQLNMTRANAKAMGVGAANSSQDLDGYILLSDLSGTGVSWDMSTDSAEAGQLDLLSTAVHEIGHALGFISGVDQPGGLTAHFSEWTGSNWNQSVTDALAQARSAMRTRTQYTNPLDLFRYSSNSGDSIDLTYGSQYSEKYFSLNGGNTALAYFASGSDGNLSGDGFQASHWKNQGTSLGVMDPTLALGERTQISGLDLTALDVIGWDIVQSRENTAIDLGALRNQAQQELASRLGTTTSWLMNNQGQAAEQLSEVRVGDIIAMAQESQVYDLSWMNASGGSSYWLNWWNNTGGDQSFWLNWWNGGGGNGWWQMMAQAFQQRGLFSQIDELPVGEVSQSSTDSITGLSPQQPVVASASGDAVIAPPAATPTAAPQEIESFESFADQQDADDSLVDGFAQFHGDLANLALGSAVSSNALEGGLAGLSQDQLQSVLGLTQAFTIDSSLG